MLLQSEENSIQSMLSSSCLLYNYWETIDALLPKMNFKRLVIIVVNDVLTGARKIESIAGKRVVPKLKRKDLHYKKQFLYDEIMKHIHLTVSNDTYYYIYPFNYNRYHDVFITYFEYKMIKDYFKVVFYFVNIFNFFELNDDNSIRSDSVIPALPDNCHLFTTNCRKRFLKPMYLISLHQEFHRRYSKYFSVYATFYSSLTEFINNHDSHHKKSNEYAQKFYNFLKGQQISYDTDYLFKDLPCSSLQKFNKKINIDFHITKFEHFTNIVKLMNTALKNITSTNITKKDNLKYFCKNSNLLTFIKFFCFLEINYVEGMLKFIDTKSHYVDRNKYMTILVEKEKNVVHNYLSNTLVWMNGIFMYKIISYFLNLNEMLKYYTEALKMISNSVDLFNTFYLLTRENVLNSTCYKKVN